MTDYTIHNRLKNLRYERHMPRTVAARLSGVPHSTIAQVEKGGTKTISPDIIRKLSKAYGVDMSPLLQLAGHLTPDEFVIDVSCGNGTMTKDGTKARGKIV